MGWDLFAWSFAVIRKNKQLILFPILSAVAALGCLYLYWHWRQSHHIGTMDYLWLVPGYLLASFAMIFFNCALAACANAHFTGPEPTLGYGLRHASRRLAPILVWTVLSTTVGIVLNTIESRFSWAGKLATWIFGTAWGMATYLVVPVLIAEDRGAFGSLRRSAQLLSKTWGDQLVAEIRFGWRGLVLFIPCMILGVMGANGYPILLPVAAVYFVIAIATLTAAKSVFEVALYRYAALNEIPASCSPEMLSIFRTQQGTTTRILDI